LVVLPLAIPASLVLGLAVALDSPGPILYRAIRVGRDGRRFRMFKFRTMRRGAAGPGVSSEEDGRYTPIGRLLAAARLDELPQLWHVLRGEMRLVGPRPEAEEFVAAQDVSYRRILSLPPGITGPTQLVFADEGRLLARSRDPERAYREDLLPRKVQLDLDYVADNSRLRDLALLVRTWGVPARQLELALAESSWQSRKHAAAAFLRAGVLVGAVVTMVALFVLQGSTAI